MKKTNKTKLIISIVSFVTSFTIFFVLGLKIKEELDAIPSKYEDYVPNF